MTARNSIIHVDVSEVGARVELIYGVVETIRICIMIGGDRQLF